LNRKHFTFILKLLLTVVVLPMIFDSEPKPLGGSVDIQIPGEDTPFEPKIMPAATPPSQGSASPSSDSREEAAAKPSAPTAAPAPARKQDAEERKAHTPDKPASAPVKRAQAPEPAKKKVEPPADEKSSRAFVSQGYFLQLGVFGNETYANQTADKAKAAGFKVSVVSVNGQSRVRVGPYPDRDKALDMQSKLKAKGFDSVLLGP